MNQPGIKNTTARNVTLAVVGALLVGGVAGLAIAGSGPEDAAPAQVGVDRAPRALILGSRPEESLAERAVAAREVPPTIAAPAVPEASAPVERVKVDEVFGPAPGASRPALGKDTRAPAPAEAPPRAVTPKASPGAASKATRQTDAKPAGAAAPGRVSLVDAKMATGVTNREPEGVGAVFGLDTEQLWAWVRVANDGPPTQITMVWRRGDEVASTHTLEVGKSAGWRTWSRKTVRRWDAGEWVVDVLDADGKAIGQLRFELRDGAPDAT